MTHVVCDTLLYAAIILPFGFVVAALVAYFGWLPGVQLNRTTDPTEAAHE